MIFRIAASGSSSVPAAVSISIPSALAADDFEGAGVFDDGCEEVGLEGALSTPLRPRAGDDPRRGPRGGERLRIPSRSLSRSRPPSLNGDRERARRSSFRPRLLSRLKLLSHRLSLPSLPSRLSVGLSRSLLLSLLRSFRSRDRDLYLRSLSRSPRLPSSAAERSRSVLGVPSRVSRRGRSVCSHMAELSVRRARFASGSAIPIFSAGLRASFCGNDDAGGRGGDALRFPS